MAATSGPRPMEMRSISCESPYRSVSLCNPSAPHAHPRLFPHPLCNPTQPQNTRRCAQRTQSNHNVTTYSQKAAATSAGGIFPSDPDYKFPETPHPKTRSYVKAPPTTPCQRSNKANNFSLLRRDTAPSTRPLDKPFTGAALVTRDLNETSVFPIPDPHSFGALADSPVLGHDQFRRHDRIVSAPISRVVHHHTKKAEPRVQHPQPRQAPPLQSHVASNGYPAAVKQLEVPEDQDPTSSPPLALPKPRTSARNARPPRTSAVALSLFPPSSPTNSLEHTRSTPSTSPTGSRCLSYGRPSVSVFEDDDEKFGLLDYWKLRVKVRKTSKFESRQAPINCRRRLSQGNWKKYLCCGSKSD